MSDALIFDLDANTRAFETSMDRAKTVTTKSTSEISRSFASVKTKIETAFATNVIDKFDQRLVATTTHAQALKAKLDGIKGQAATSFAAGQGATASGLAGQVIGAGGIKNFAALSGGGLGVAALAAGFIAQQAQAYAALQKTATEAGLTADQVAGLQNILGRVGVSSADTAQLLTNLHGKLLDAKAGSADVASAFQTAGIAFQNADGTIRPTIDVLQDVEKYLKSTASEADKSKLATATFGQQLGGEFVTAVKQAGSALDDLKRASHDVGSAIINDLAKAATQGVGYLNILTEKLDQYYSRFKQIAHLEVGDKDKSNAARLNYDQAVNDRDALTRRFEDRPGHVSEAFGGADFKPDPEALKAANEKLFAAAADLAKVDPIRVIPGGDPRVKPGDPKPATPTPAATPDPSAHDDDEPSNAGHAKSSGGGSNDRVDTVINSLAREEAAEKGMQAALGQTDQARQRSIDLAKAQEAASERGSALTEEERAKVIALADGYSQAHKAIEDFQRQQKAAEEGAKSLASTFEGAIEGLVISGTSLGDTFKSLLKTLESSALKAILTGEGPLAGLLGTASSGKGAASVGGIAGLFTGLFSGLKLADGGSVRGPGTSRSDSVPAMLSHGEFVVNAASAAKNAGLLALINSGKVMRLADGGMVGAMRAIPTAVAMTGGGSNVVYAPTTPLNVMPAQGVTPAQLQKVIEQNNRENARNFLKTYDNARRRY